MEAGLAGALPQGEVGIPGHLLCDCGSILTGVQKMTGLPFFKTVPRVFKHPKDKCSLNLTHFLKTFMFMFRCLIHQCSSQLNVWPQVSEV